MKKLIVLLILLFSVKAHAAMDIQNSPRPSLWRSSRTASADNFVLIATGAIHFHEVKIGTAAPNSGLFLFNSTTPNTNLTTYFTTAATIDLSQNTKTPDPYDMYFSSGLVYQKLGTADINILWDFVIPRREPLVPFSPSDRP